MAHPRTRQQQPPCENGRNLPVSYFSLKRALPNMSRNRFPRCIVLSCLADSARSLSVKGSASCSLRFSSLPSGDGCWEPCSEIDREVSIILTVLKHSRLIPETDCIDLASKKVSIPTFFHFSFNFYNLAEIEIREGPMQPLAFFLFSR